MLAHDESCSFLGRLDIDRDPSTPPGHAHAADFPSIFHLIIFVFFSLLCVCVCVFLLTVILLFHPHSVPTFMNLQEETLIKIADVLDEVRYFIHNHFWVLFSSLI